MNSHLFLTTSGAYKIPIYAWLTMAGIFFYNAGFSADITLIAYKLSVFLGWALIIFSVFYILSTITVISGSSDSYGVLGKHTYELQENGFVESTDVNETFTNWKGIYRLIKTNNYVYIKTAPSLAHVIPKRCFSNEKEFEEFYSRLKTGHENASNKAI